MLHEVFVNPWPFADLVTSEVVAPAFAVEGASFEVGYTVTNLGSGPTDRDELDGTNLVDKGQEPATSRPRGHATHHAAVCRWPIRSQCGLRSRGISVTLPASLVSGTYYITPWADPYAQVEEDTLAVNVNPDDPTEIDNNNYKARRIDIIGTPPPPVDIEVTAVVPDATGVAGEEFTVSWEVSNVGVGQTRSGWTDTVYLSRTPHHNDPGAEAIMLGRFANVSILAAGTGVRQYASFPTETGRLR